MTAYHYPIIPRLSAPTSVTAMMIDVIVALLPALGMSVYLFGVDVLWRTVCSIGFCIFFQILCSLWKGRELLDPSPWVTGLLLAFCCPPEIPLYTLLVPAFFSIVIVKEVYGGLGHNFINPALAGRIFLASAPLLMTQFSQPKPMVEANLVDAMSSATPLTALQQGQLPEPSLEELFLGFYSGSMGEVSALMLLLGGCYLLLRRVITPTIPLSFLGTVAFLCYHFPQGGQDPYLWMMSHLFSGGLMLAAFFMATDPVTSPVTFRGQILFGIGCGALTVLLRYYGSYPEGVGFAILTMNGIVWLLDRLGMPRFFGQGHFSTSQSSMQYVSSRCNNISFILPKITTEFLPKLANLLQWKDILSHWKKHLNAISKGDFTLLSLTARCVLSYGLVFCLSIGAISLTQSLSSLAQHRASEKAILALLAVAMPEAEFMSETPYHGEDFQHIYLAFNSQEEIGYCIEVEVSGFVSDISLLVGVDLKGAVTGVAVISHHETKYLGEAFLEEENLSLYRGRSGTIDSLSIDGVSGATITLQAVTQGVNQALRTVQYIAQTGILDEMEHIS